MGISAISVWSAFEVCGFGLCGFGRVVLAVWFWLCGFGDKKSYLSGG